MLKSMTAYGRACISNSLGRFIAEIQTVNKKFLEIQIRLPREFDRFECDIRKWISHSIQRGHVHITISAFFEQENPFIIRPNFALAKQLKAAWDQMFQEIGVNNIAFNPTLLTSEKGLFQYDEDLQHEEFYKETLKSTIESALYQCQDMKIKEGKALADDILSRIHALNQWIEKIALRGKDATVKVREKLISRLEELFPGIVDNEDRILREICIFAEKIDIAEEITRFRFHINHLEKLIAESPGQGKKIRICGSRTESRS